MPAFVWEESCVGGGALEEELKLWAFEEWKMYEIERESVFHKNVVCSIANVGECRISDLLT